MEKAGKEPISSDFKQLITSPEFGLAMAATAIRGLMKKSNGNGLNATRDSMNLFFGTLENHGVSAPDVVKMSEDQFQLFIGFLAESCVRQIVNQGGDGPIEKK